MFQKWFHVWKVFIYLLSINSVYSSDFNLENYNDGPCIKNISDYVAPNIDQFWSAGARDYYVPMASTRAYLGYAEALLGRSVKSLRELEGMKLRINNQLLPPVVTNYGYQDKKYFRQLCLPNGLNVGYLLCYPIPLTGTDESNTTVISKSEDTILWTDNISTVLFYRCVNNEVKDFKALTTTPKPLKPEIEKEILKIVLDLGFNAKFIKYMKYEDEEIKSKFNIKSLSSNGL